MCHTAPGGCHCTCTGVPCCSLSDRFYFDAIFLRCKEEANDGGDSAGGRGGCGGLGGLCSHEELDVMKGERGGDCVCSPVAVFTGSYEK